MESWEGASQGGWGGMKLKRFLLRYYPPGIILECVRDIVVFLARSGWRCVAGWLLLPRAAPLSAGV